MRRPKPQPIRNRLDLSDRAQVRLVRKRYRLSDSELNEVVGRIGNSLSAIGKEVALQRAKALPQRTDTPPADVIATVTATEQATADGSTSEPAL